jgi:RND family efflux transporter MFP subunit
VFCALSILLLAAGCSRQDSARSDEARPVKTMVVSAGGEPFVRSFPGKAEASKKVELAFQVEGPLESLPVREGQTVSKGDMIAQLRQKDFTTQLERAQSDLDQARAALRALRSGERPEQQLRLEANVRAADAQVANAQADFDRYRRLLQSRAVSRSEFDRAERVLRVALEEQTAARQALRKGATGREEEIEAKEAEVRGLEGRVVEANLRLKDSTLLAPYDGVIAQRFVEQGQSIKPRQPIVKFQDVDEIDVVVDVPEKVMAADLRTADIVQLVAEFSTAPGQQFPAHIKEVAQRADPVTQTFPVRVALKAPPGVNLLPGMTATVTLTYHRAGILGDRILVPVSAVAKDAAGEQVAWVVQSDETVKPRPVKLGEATGGQVEIVDGLKPGDRIAVAGVTFLREGMKVRDLGDALGGGS